MNLLDFVKLATLEGKISYARINKDNLVMIADDTNSLLVHAQSKINLGLKQDLCIGDTEHFLKVLSLLGENAKLEVSGSSIVLSNKSSRFVIEMLSTCSNYVAEGTDALNTILNKTDYEVKLNGAVSSRISDILKLYQKPIISFFSEGSYLFAGIADLAFADKVKQYSTVMVEGDREVNPKSSPFEYDNPNWYSGLFLIDIFKLLNGMEVEMKLCFSERLPLVITGTSDGAEVYFCLSPTSVMEVGG